MALSGFPEHIAVVLGAAWNGVNGLAEDEIVELTKISGQDGWSEDGTDTPDSATNRLKIRPKGSNSGGSTLVLQMYGDVAVSSAWSYTFQDRGVFAGTTETRYIFKDLWAHWGTTSGAWYYTTGIGGFITGAADFNPDIFKSIQFLGLSAVVGPVGLIGSVVSPVQPLKSLAVSPVAAVGSVVSGVTPTTSGAANPVAAIGVVPAVQPRKSVIGIQPVTLVGSIGQVAGGLGSDPPLVAVLRGSPRRGSRGRSRQGRFTRGKLIDASPFRTRYYLDARGLYRIFNEAGYRFYRSNTAPPVEGDTPWATSATLPATPADAFADGVWYLSVSYFNGVLDSGFFPLGAKGETYLRLEISGGELVGDAPPGPAVWQLARQAGGVIRIDAAVYAAGDARPEQWAIAYTTNGSDPPEDTPDATQTIAAGGLGVLQYDLPAQADGTTVKVRLQTRRNVGTAGSPSWVYSPDSTIKSLTAATVGPTAPIHLAAWPGRRPGSL